VEGTTLPALAHLRGRQPERERIDALLDAARSGRSGVLVLRGEAGIGKSSLLRHAVEAAGADVPVLSAVGLESESDLAFAALHQLLRPVLERVDSLPPPQADAVRRAFGLAEGPIANPFLISLATLTLLADVADHRGLLCVVDDAHWLDRSSADVLLSIARRLDVEGIALLLAARDGASRRLLTASLPELQLDGLDERAAAELLEELTGGELDAGVRGRLLAVARGNPLALLELPGSLTREQLAGIEPLPEPLPIGEQVEHAFLERAGGLTPAAQAFLLVAAADDTEQVATVCDAATRLGIGDTALDELEEARLVTVDGPRIAFRHPLVRSAVYRAAISRERRRAHLALADVLGAGGDASRRAWHRAAAARGPDDAIAADLDAAARQARTRGAHGAAAVTFERAAALTTVDATRGRRLLDAAQASMRSGRTDHVVALVDRARPLLDDERDHAELALLHGSCELERGALAEAFELLMDGSRCTLAADPAAALRMLHRAGEASWWAGDSAWSDEVAALAARIGVSCGWQVSTRALLVGSAMLLRDEFEAGAEQLRTVAVPDAGGSDPRAWLSAAAAALYCGDEAAAEEGYARASDVLRAQGAIGELPYALCLTASCEIALGRFAAAEANATEALRLAVETHQDTVRSHAGSVLASIAALRGRAEECHARAAEALELATARGVGASAHNARLALGRLELGNGRPAEALAHLVAVGEAGSVPPSPLVSLLASPDLVEAALRVGQPALARERFERYARWVTAVRSRTGVAIASRLRGLLGDGGDPDREFERAIAVHVDDRRPFELARARLLYGERLRRTRRRLDAREQLRAAQQGFDALGAVGWANRAAAELRASGETARRAPASAPVALTPQERQIARFVIEGASNREVAAQLFVSRRTVEHHLSRVFAKLGISSRVELARALGELDGA
jgi:DNA-binding CsgD family transcriptional regulator